MECLRVLENSGVPPSDLKKRPGEHHFMGFGLWFRNRFYHRPSSLLDGYFYCPDTASSFFSDLIATHGNLSETEWEVILEHTELPVGFGNLGYYVGPKPILLRLCKDQDL
jgi:hypothetical protein